MGSFHREVASRRLMSLTQLGVFWFSCGAQVFSRLFLKVRCIPCVRKGRQEGTSDRFIVPGQWCDLHSVLSGEVRVMVLEWMCLDARNNLPSLLHHGATPKAPPPLWFLVFFLSYAKCPFPITTCSSFNLPKALFSIRPSIECAVVSL